LCAAKSIYGGPDYRVYQEEKKIQHTNMTAANPRILLSGASGMLGGALRKVFATRGLPVLQLVRRPPACSDEIRWNPAGSPVIEESDEKLGGLAAAVHLSGASVAAHRWTSAYKREMTLSRVVSTHELATLLAGLKNPPQVLLVASATGIYGDRGDEVLDESSAPGSGFLADVCQEWEAAAEPARAAGIRVVHLRFGVVLGPGPGALAKMAPVFRLGLGGRMGSGRQWMSWISLADAVRAMLFVLDTPGLAGPVNLTAPKPVTNMEFTRAMGVVMRRPEVLPVPAFALRLALGEMADEALLASARVMPARLMAAGFQFEYPTIVDALAVALAEPR
jgi:uncharacterized protein (TIGR01777 family)